MGSFVGSDVDGGNTATLTGISWPTVQSGDTAILVWTMSTSVLPTTPSGFTQYEAFDGNSGSQRNRIFYKVCDGAETGTLTLTLDTSTRQTAVLWVGRGFDQTNPIDGSARFDETVSGTTHDAPAYTLVAANCGILTAIGERGTTGTNDYTPPTSFDQNHADTTTLGVGTGGTITAVASDDLATARSAGANVNPGVWTSANGFVSNNAVVWTIGLKPDAALSGTVTRQITADIAPVGTGQGTSTLAASVDISVSGEIVQDIDANQAGQTPAPMFIAPNLASLQPFGTAAPQTGNLEGTSALAVAVAITANGVVSATGNATRTITATITANGVVRTESTAALTVTATITATGVSDATPVPVGETRVETGAEHFRVTVGFEKMRIATGHQTSRATTGG